MHDIEDWKGTGKISLVQSRGGVLAAVDPLANLVRANVAPWPTPEVLQKLYASHRWKGKTEADESEARRVLGHYCDLQSLNSEDAITWSFFGPLIYGPSSWKDCFTSNLFQTLGLAEPKATAIWLWRRIPHPEKPDTQGGPELDFGILSDTTVILGEAKWNSSIGSGQGIAGNRTQLDLRKAYCAVLGRLAMPHVRQWCVLGVGRKADVLACEIVDETKVHNMTWLEVSKLMPVEFGDELRQYLAWKERYSS